MKISRYARNKYQFDDSMFTEQGNINFGGDIYAVRTFVQKINQKRDLISFPEKAVYTGEIYGMGLLFEINDYIFSLYKKESGEKSINEDLFSYLQEKIGIKKLNSATRVLLEEFPPQRIYSEELNIDKFLEDTTNNVTYLDEFISLWIGNMNSALSSHLDLFDDGLLEKKTAYNDIIDEIKTFFYDKPTFKFTDQNLIELLREPALINPHSIKDQLEYIREHWSEFLDHYFYKILLALDLIREEEMLRGLGPGESKVYEYDMGEIEAYTPDKEWMPKVVMIAKNIYVWLDQLSKKYSINISKLHEIPNEELDQLRKWGFNGLWLIGLWERSTASKKIKRWCGNLEAEASAYSLYDYVIAYDLGGYDSYNNLKDRAGSRGIRLASDMVPNHTGIVSKWTMEHPDWYVDLPYPPFPSYTYSGENLSGNSDIGIYLEDKYFSRTDAAVTFKRVDFRNNETRYVYHGNDGTSFPWNDTAQLNFLNPEVREALIQTILHVSRMFPIIRFDAAMTLTRKHFQRLWFPEPGTGGAIPSRAEHGISRNDFLKAMPKEFWREVVDRINKENPDTLLLAEAFWLLEGFFVRTLGMHRVYNSAFMNMLRDEDNANYRAVMKNTLEFDPKILKRFVNFMNNPDEETSIKQFGDGDKYFGICCLLVTQPGLPMFGHGQIEGFHEKYGMEYRRSYWNEPINVKLLKHHERTIFPIMRKRYLFAEVDNFLLYDFWKGSYVNEDVFAFSNKVANERGLVIYHNKYAETKGFIKNSVGFAVKNGDDKKIIQRTLSEGINLPLEGYCIFKDYMTGLEYIRKNREIHEKGLYVELRAYQAFVFLDFQIIQDNKYFHYAQLYNYLNGKGVPNINETLQQLIYQPLHSHFEEIINEKSFKDIINKNTREEHLDFVNLKLKDLLEEIRKYSSGKADISSLKENIMIKLKNVLEIERKLKKIVFSQDVSDFIEDLIPKTPFEGGIVLTWVLLHQLGMIVSDKNYELRSRSWIDEWHLSKFIQLTLKNLSTKKEEKAWEVIPIIKLMILLQNWWLTTHKKKGDYLSVLLSEPEVQQFLNVNRFQDVLWFDAEAFSRFTRWLSVITIIDIFENVKEDFTEEIEKRIKVILKWKEAAKESKFQVEKLLEIVNQE